MSAKQLNLNECYQRLADIICNSLDANWQNAYIYAEVHDNWVELEGKYVDAQGELQWYEIEDDSYLPLNADRTLRLIRDLMKQEGYEMWVYAVFEIKNDGSFSLNVTYPGKD